MTDVPHNGSQSTPTQQTVPSPSNSDSSIEDGHISPPEPQFPKFNEFPPEIQRYIFEMAYDAHTNCIGWGDPDDLEYWASISKQVGEWMEPLIYESMILPEYWEDRDDSLERLILYEEAFEKKPNEFFTKHVRKIYTNNMNCSKVDHDFEIKLLPICDNLTTLECWSRVKKELQTILQIKYWPKLKDLCINLDLLLPLDENTFHFPLFRNVTHLDLCTTQPQLLSWKSLESLENLTHMRVNMLSRISPDDFRHVVDQAHNIASETQKYFPPRLEYFVIVVPLESLCALSTEPRETLEDTVRWERMENVRLGTFNSRILLGATDFICGLSEDDADYPIFQQYLKLIAYIKDDQECPRAWQDPELWEVVMEICQERKSFVASQRSSYRANGKVWCVFFFFFLW